MFSLPQWLSSRANSRVARPIAYATVIAIIIFAGDWTIHNLTNAHGHDDLRLEELRQDILLSATIGILLYYLFSGFIRSAARYRVLSEGVREMLLILGSDHRIIDANDSAEREYGRKRDELLGVSMATVTVDRDDSTSAVGAVLRTGVPVLAEGLHRRKDGTTFPVEVSASLSELCGEPVVLAVIRDISERRRRESFTQLLREADRAILAGEPVESILSGAVKELAQLFPGALVQFALKSEDHSVGVRAWAGAHEEFLDGIEIRWDDTPLGRGPTGAAIRSGEVQTSIIATDPSFEPWRDRALECGFQAAFAVPLTVEDEVLGAITLFCEHADAVSGSGLAALQVFADQVALSILSGRHLERIDLQRLALESVANAVVVADRHGLIEWVNPAFSSLTGFGLAEARGRTMNFFRAGNAEDSFNHQMWETIRAGRVWRGEVSNRRLDGTLYQEEQMITPMKDAGGEISHFVSVGQDITARRQTDEQLRYVALHDPLTSLPNRSLLVENLDRLVRRAHPRATSFLVVMDIDDFKIIDDSLGQIAGDQILRQFAEVLGAATRPGDMAARIGGDEFAVIVGGSNLPGATGFAERIRQAIEARAFRFGSRTSWITASVGVVMIDGGADTDTLLSRVGAAVHVAKERGKNRVVVWDETHANGGGLIEAGQWVPRIKEALQADRFVLVHQPVVNLITGEADHYEALLRMRGEDGELIAPDRFMRAAERYGLMPQIDRWVVENTMSLLARRDGFRVFVNLGAESLADESLLDLISRRLKEKGISPPRLAFEVTETTAVADFAAARGWIDRAKELGCMFALDDFGVGFSSLSYLRMLSVDWVKIDKSFISDIHTDSTSRALVQAVKTVATTLGKQVIAEGVECEEHADVLRELGVGHGQGYHWGRPSLQMQFHEEAREATTFH